MPMVLNYNQGSCQQSPGPPSRFLDKLTSCLLFPEALLVTDSPASSTKAPEDLLCAHGDSCPEDKDGPYKDPCVWQSVPELSLLYIVQSLNAVQK